MKHLRSFFYTIIMVKWLSVARGQYFYGARFLGRYERCETSYQCDNSVCPPYTTSSCRCREDMFFNGECYPGTKYCDCYGAYSPRSFEEHRQACRNSYDCDDSMCPYGVTNICDCYSDQEVNGVCPVGTTFCDCDGEAPWSVITQEKMKRPGEVCKKSSECDDSYCSDDSVNTCNCYEDQEINGVCPPGTKTCECDEDDEPPISDLENECETTKQCDDSLCEDVANICDCYEEDKVNGQCPPGTKFCDCDGPPTIVVRGPMINSTFPPPRYSSSNHDLSSYHQPRYSSSNHDLSSYHQPRYSTPPITRPTTRLTTRETTRRPHRSRHSLPPIIMPPMLMPFMPMMKNQPMMMMKNQPMMMMPHRKRDKWNLKNETVVKTTVKPTKTTYTSKVDTTKPHKKEIETEIIFEHETKHKKPLVIESGKEKFSSVSHIMNVPTPKPVLSHSKPSSGDEKDTDHAESPPLYRIPVTNPTLPSEADDEVKAIENSDPSSGLVRSQPLGLVGLWSKRLIGHMGHEYRNRKPAESNKEHPIENSRNKAERSTGSDEIKKRFPSITHLPITITAIKDVDDSRSRGPVGLWKNRPIGLFGVGSRSRIPGESKRKDLLGILNSKSRHNTEDNLEMTTDKQLSPVDKPTTAFSIKMTPSHTSDSRLNDNGTWWRDRPIGLLINAFRPKTPTDPPHNRAMITSEDKVRKTPKSSLPNTKELAISRMSKSTSEFQMDVTPKVIDMNQPHVSDGLRDNPVFKLFIDGLRQTEPNDKENGHTILMTGDSTSDDSKSHTNQQKTTNTPTKITLEGSRPSEILWRNKNNPLKLFIDQLKPNNTTKSEIPEKNLKDEVRYTRQSDPTTTLGMFTEKRTDNSVGYRATKFDELAVRVNDESRTSHTNQDLTTNQATTIKKGIEKLENNDAIKLTNESVSADKLNIYVAVYVINNPVGSVSDVLIDTRKNLKDSSEESIIESNDTLSSDSTGSLNEQKMRASSVVLNDTRTRGAVGIQNVNPIRSDIAGFQHRKTNKSSTNDHIFNDNTRFSTVSDSSKVHESMTINEFEPRHGGEYKTGRTIMTPNQDDEFTFEATTEHSTTLNVNKSRDSGVSENIPPIKKIIDTIRPLEAGKPATGNAMLLVNNANVSTGIVADELQPRHRDDYSTNLALKSTQTSPFELGTSHVKLETTDKPSILNTEKSKVVGPERLRKIRPINYLVHGLRNQERSKSTTDDPMELATQETDFSKLNTRMTVDEFQPRNNGTFKTDNPLEVVLTTLDQSTVATTVQSTVATTVQSMADHNTKLNLSESPPRDSGKLKNIRPIKHIFDRIRLQGLGKSQTENSTLLINKSHEATNAHSKLVTDELDLQPRHRDDFSTDHLVDHTQTSPFKSDTSPIKLETTNKPSILNTEKSKISEPERLWKNRPLRNQGMGKLTTEHLGELGTREFLTSKDLDFSKLNTKTLVNGPTKTFLTKLDESRASNIVQSTTNHPTISMSNDSPPYGSAAFENVRPIKLIIDSLIGRESDKSRENKVTVINEQPLLSKEDLHKSFPTMVTEEFQPRNIEMHTTNTRERKSTTMVASTANNPANVASTANNPANVASTANNPANVASTANNPANVASTANNPANVASTANSPANVASTANSPANVASTANNPANVASTANSPANVASTANSPANVASTANNPARYIPKEKDPRQRFADVLSNIRSIKHIIDRIPLRESEKSTTQPSMEPIKEEIFTGEDWISSKAPTTIETDELQPRRKDEYTTDHLKESTSTISFESGTDEPSKLKTEKPRFLRPDRLFKNRPISSFVDKFRAKGSDKETTERSTGRIYEAITTGEDRIWSRAPSTTESDQLQPRRKNEYTTDHLEESTPTTPFEYETDEPSKLKTEKPRLLRPDRLFKNRPISSFVAKFRAKGSDKETTERSTGRIYEAITTGEDRILSRAPTTTESDQLQPRRKNEYTTDHHLEESTPTTSFEYETDEPSRFKTEKPRLLRPDRLFKNRPISSFVDKFRAKGSDKETTERSTGRIYEAITTGEDRIWSRAPSTTESDQLQPRRKNEYTTDHLEESTPTTPFEYETDEPSKLKTEKPRLLRPDRLFKNRPISSFVDKFRAKGSDKETTELSKGRINEAIIIGGEWISSKVPTTTECDQLQPRRKDEYTTDHLEESTPTESTTTETDESRREPAARENRRPIRNFMDRLRARGSDKFNENKRKIAEDQTSTNKDDFLQVYTTTLTEDMQTRNNEAYTSEDILEMISNTLDESRSRVTEQSVTDNPGKLTLDESSPREPTVLENIRPIKFLMDGLRARGKDKVTERRKEVAKDQTLTKKDDSFQIYTTTLTEDLQTGNNEAYTPEDLLGMTSTTVHPTTKLVVGRLGKIRPIKHIIDRLRAQETGKSRTELNDEKSSTSNEFVTSDLIGSTTIKLDEFLSSTMSKRDKDESCRGKSCRNRPKLLILDKLRLEKVDDSMSKMSLSLIKDQSTTTDYMNDRKLEKNSAIVPSYRGRETMTMTSTTVKNPHSVIPHERITDIYATMVPTKDASFLPPNDSGVLWKNPIKFLIKAVEIRKSQHRPEAILDESEPVKKNISPNEGISKMLEGELPTDSNTDVVDNRKVTPKTLEESHFVPERVNFDGLRSLKTTNADCDVSEKKVTSVTTSLTNGAGESTTKPDTEDFFETNTFPSFSTTDAVTWAVMEDAELDKGLPNKYYTRRTRPSCRFGFRSVIGRDGLMRRVICSSGERIRNRPF